MARISVADVLLDWRFDPAAALLLVTMSAAYATGVARLAHRGRRWPVGRSLCWLLAVLAGVVATQSGIGRYDGQRFTVHMVQHLLLGMVVPFAAVCAAPLTLALQAGGPATRQALRSALRSRWARLLSHPVVTWLLFGGGLIVVYLTPVLALSARNRTVHLLVHTHLVVAGSLFLAGLVGSDPSPRPLPYGARLLSVLTAVPFHAFLGLVLLTAATPLAPAAYPSLSDQRTGAGLLWGMGELFTLAVAAVVVRRWYVADLRD
ncbi:MAG: copper resistance domain protein, partial [Acidimicrobiales bacterium]|nr:copper resistance domain protein [Acidimicrobiales bacterium]